MIFCDSEIRAQCPKGWLISEAYQDSNLDGCSYEFRVGPIAYRYDYDNKSSRQENVKQHLIYPFETLTLITLEKVRLGRHHFLLLFSKGSMFSLGLVPICTAADPGFTGHLGITITNLSARPVILPVGTRLIKGLFFKLDVGAEKTYVGQHGDAMMNWPYPNQFHADEFDPEVYASHLRRFLPSPFASAFELPAKIHRYLKWTIVSLLLAAGGNLSTYFLSVITPQIWTERLFTLLSALGSIASVVGLIISIVALWVSRKATR